MTQNQFKAAMNSELRANDLGEHYIAKVEEIGTNTVLRLDLEKHKPSMKLYRFLNNRFQNGIRITSEDQSLVFINTPLQEKIEID